MRWLSIVAASGLGCSKPAEPAAARDPAATAAPEHVADVKAVTVSGDPNAYTFAVTIASPDTGCDRYANWWEVVGEDGRLLYRRILRHSHVDDQPFERSGGPVEIGADTRVFVRAHMHPGGYGGTVMVGTPAEGFGHAEAPPQLDPAIESAAPQPQGCDH